MQHCVHLSGHEGSNEPEIGDKPRHSVCGLIQDMALFSDRGVVVALRQTRMMQD
jgi:hypothetical protein